MYISKSKRLIKVIRAIKLTKLYGSKAKKWKRRNVIIEHLKAQLLSEMLTEGN